MAKRGAARAATDSPTTSFLPLEPQSAFERLSPLLPEPHSALARSPPECRLCTPLPPPACAGAAVPTPHGRRVSSERPHPRGGDFDVSRSRDQATPRGEVIP